MSPLWPSAPAFPGTKTGVVGADGVPAGQAVTVKRRPRFTRPGSTEPQLGEWKDAESWTVENVGLDELNSSEDRQDYGDAVTRETNLYGPADADIAWGDRVVFPGGPTVLVIGIPNRQPNMVNGWQPPMRVAVRVTNG